MTRTRDVGGYCEISVFIGPDEYRRKTKTLQEAKPFFDRASKAGVSAFIVRYREQAGTWREEMAHDNRGPQ